MSKATNIIYHTQNDGTKIQGIGLGTYASVGGSAERAVKWAIDAGYRHIDTAYFYENEEEIGSAIRSKIAEGVVKREDMYVVTKMWSHFHDPKLVEHACRLSLRNLNISYIDCYLMHWPYAFKYYSDTNMLPTDANGVAETVDIDYLDTWKAMEKLVEQGLVKSIGVSNFNSEQLARLLANCKIKPIHNQIECHPDLNQEKMIALCKKHDILVTAYCPLGRPDYEKKEPKYVFDERVAAIAAKYNKTPTQIGLRFLIELGVVPLPKSEKKERIIENFNIFDFQLTPDEIKLMKSFNTGHRLIPMEYAKHDKYYPFNIEY